MNNIDFEAFFINNVDIFHTINVESHNLKQCFNGNEWNILKSSFFSIIAQHQFPQFFGEYDDDVNDIKGDLKYKISNCIVELKGRTNDVWGVFSTVNNYVKLKPSKKRRTDEEIIEYFDSKKPYYIIIHCIDTLLCTSTLVLCSTVNCNFIKKEHSVDITDLIIIHQHTKQIQLRQAFCNGKRHIQDTIIKLYHQQKQNVPIQPKCYTAFGETKTLYDWINDDRCSVEYQTIVNRLNSNAIKMSFEEIITRPKNSKRKKSFKQEIKDIFGFDLEAEAKKLKDSQETA
jgi:hypothetical protein